MFFALFMVAKQYHDRNNVFHCEPRGEDGGVGGSLGEWRSLITAFFGVLRMFLITFTGKHSTGVSIKGRLVSGETLFLTKNFTGRRWGSNPGPCRQHGHC